MPVDFDGDGYHEFYGAGGAKKGCVVDREGKVQALSAVTEWSEAARSCSGRVNC